MVHMHHLFILFLWICGLQALIPSKLDEYEQVLLNVHSPHLTIANNGPSSAEIQALQDLYNSAGGQYWSWKNTSVYGPIWDFSTAVVNPCQPPWQGVFCNADSTSITQLQLSYSNITGYIPHSIVNLTQLESINFEVNALKQRLPSFLCELKALNSLELLGNQFSGSIPSCFLNNLANLTFFIVDLNKITGRLPEIDVSSSFLAKKLIFFSASYNFLHGTIPSTYSTFQQMQDFTVEYNMLTGDTSVCWTWPLATVIGLANNAFEGSLDRGSTLVMPLLAAFQVQSNFFTGTLPSILQFSNNIIICSVFKNLLTGTLPSYISGYSRLVYLTVNDNLFSGTLDAALSYTFPYLIEAMFFANLFTGTLPHFISTWPLVEGLFLQDNHFHGNLAPAFNTSTQHLLRLVDVSSNHFTGTIPKDLFPSSLLILNAFNLCLAPTLPSYICDAKNLQVLALDGITSYCSRDIWPEVPDSPKLSRTVMGGIPECIWTDMKNLAALYLSGNGLSGTIPSLDSYSLLAVDLSFNSLSGSIPKALQTSDKLIQLDLKSNKFNGEIIDLQHFYQNARNVSLAFSLDLSVNRLSGPIPSEFSSVNSIEIVGGNLFQCSKSSPTPEHDPNSEGYVCGSDLLDISLWGFLGACLILFIVGILLLVTMKDIIYGHRIKWCSSAKLQKASKRLCLQIRACTKKNRENGNTTHSEQRGNTAIEIPTRSDTTSVDKSNRQSEEAVFVEDEEEEEKEEVNFEQSYDPRRRGMRQSFFDGTRLSMTDRMTEMLHIMPVVSSVQETMTFINDGDRLEQSVQVWMELTPSNEKGKLIFRDTYHRFVLYLLVALWWRSKAKSVQAENTLQYAKAVKELPHLILFLKSMKLIRRLSLALMLVIVFFTVPTYFTLKTYFATYTKQYRWNISAAFLSGYEPGIAIFFMWAITLYIIVFMIDRYVPMDSERYDDILGTNSTVDSTSSNHSVQALFSATSGASSEMSVERLRLRDDTFSIDSSNTNSTTSSSWLSSSMRTTELFNKVADNSKFSLWYLYRRLIGPSMWFSIFALLCNLLVVLTIKALFIYMLVTINLCWDNLVVPMIITSLPKKKSTSRMLLKTAMLFFNGILAPCISLAVVDTSCFNGLFQPAPAEYKSYHLFYCTSYLTPQACQRISQLAKVEKYVPVFHYNYNCYSTILNEYLPIFFISFIFLTFFNPLLALFLAQTSKKFDWKQLNVFPTIYFTPNHSEQSDSRWLVKIWKEKSVDNTADPNPQASATPEPVAIKPWLKPKKVFYPDFLLATLMHQMLVMLTFGMMYPPLAVAIAIVICIKSFTWEVLIGRWMVRDGFDITAEINGGVNFGMGNPLLLRNNVNHSTIAGIEEERLRDSSTSMNSSSTASTVVPMKIGQFTRQLEAVCKDAGCGPRRCLGLIAYGSGTFYAFVLFDMVGDKLGYTRSLWAPILVLAYATALIMLLKSNVTKKQHQVRTESHQDSSGSNIGRAVLTEAAVDQLRQSSVQRETFSAQKGPLPPPRPVIMKAHHASEVASNPLHSSKVDNEEDGHDLDTTVEKDLGIELRPISSRSSKPS